MASDIASAILHLRELPDAVPNPVAQCFKCWCVIGPVVRQGSLYCLCAGCEKKWREQDPETWKMIDSELGKKPQEPHK